MFVGSLFSILSFTTSASSTACSPKEEHVQHLYRIAEVLGLLDLRQSSHGPQVQLNMNKFVYDDLCQPSRENYWDKTAYIVDEVVEGRSKEGDFLLLSEDVLRIRPAIPSLTPLRLHVSGRLFALEAGLVRDANHNLRAFVKLPAHSHFVQVLDDKRVIDIALITSGARVKANGTFSLTRIEQVLTALNEGKNHISSFHYLLYKDIGMERCAFPFSNIPLWAGLMRESLSEEMATLRIQLVRLLQLLKQRGDFAQHDFQNKHLQKAFSLLKQGPQSNYSETWRREMLSVLMLTTPGLKANFISDFFQMEPQLSERFLQASLLMVESDGHYDLVLKDCKIKSKDTIVFLIASSSQIPLSAILTTVDDTPMDYSLTAFVDDHGVLSRFKVDKDDVEIANFGPYPHKEIFTIDRYTSDRVQTFFRGYGIAFYAPA